MILSVQFDNEFDLNPYYVPEYYQMIIIGPMSSQKNTNCLIFFSKNFMKDGERILVYEKTMILNTHY